MTEWQKLIEYNCFIKSFSVSPNTNRCDAERCWTKAIFFHLFAHKQAAYALFTLHDFKHKDKLANLYTERSESVI